MKLFDVFLLMMLCVGASVSVAQLWVRGILSGETDWYALLVLVAMFVLAYYSFR